MKNAVRWMATNHVAANLLMIVLIVGGLVNGFAVKQEVFPEISLDRIQVTVLYPGAGPEEVEEGVLLKIEESLTGVDGIKEVRSVAREGVGIVTAELMAGEDADLKLQEIKSEVDRIVTFPEEAEKPVVTKLLNRNQVISIVVYGDVPERALKEQAEMIRDELLSMPEITQVYLGGVRPYEISIDISSETLRRYNLTLEGVADIVRGASIDLPGGTIKTTPSEILIRTKERRYSGEEYRDIVVLTKPDGTQLRLGDIAVIRDGFAETDLSAAFDGKPAALINVYRVGDQKPIEIAALVRDYVEKKRETLPSSISIATWGDRTELLRSRMFLLEKNAALGLMLVIIILGLFLEIRLALWVMLGIPISFLGALLLMPVLDVSINMISLFAFILALGIVVDDAIIVGENIFEHRAGNNDFEAAAVKGVMEVAVPVVFSVLTTVAAFLPLLFVSGLMGKFIRVIPLIVISLLVVSLVESLFVLPAHLSFGNGERRAKGRITGFIERVRLGFTARMERFIDGPFSSLLRLALHHRYTSLSIGIASLAVTAGIVGGGLVKTQFMPVVDGDVITARIEMPPGTSQDETAKVVRYLEEMARETVAEFDSRMPEGRSVLRNIYSVIGGTIVGGGPEGGSSLSKPNIASMGLFLTQSEERGIPAVDIASRWKEKIGEVAGVESIVIKSTVIHMGANIDIQMSHEDFRVLEAAAERVKEALSRYPGVSDITDNFSKGARELKIRLKPEARTLGVTETSLARQIRSAFYGAEALRIQRGRNEVKVMVRYPEEERRSMSDLESMFIRTPAGGEIPLAMAASVTEGYGFSEINRTERKRVVNVTASVDDKTANAQEILRDLKTGLLPGLVRDYPGLSFNLEGEEKERRQSMGSMKRGFLLAMVGIYALLAIPFRSYSQPLLIMAAIPFGLVGAVMGHIIMGFNLSILSMFGIVALSGVVVNDSLLLIDRINNNRRAGMELAGAVMEAARRRFRPIMLTSLTTFFGLSPMIMETSVQAQFLIPMAISLGFGILFATGITLLIIPSLYMILEDVRGVFGIHGIR